MSNIETWTEKFSRKFKENPLVPLGAAATVVTLIIASKKMRRGESQQMNHWLRARVAAQGFTILAICGGTYWMNKQKREATLTEVSQGGELDAEKLRLDKERREFEERLQEAEKAHRTLTESQGSGTGSSSKASELNTSTNPTPPSSNGTQQSWLEWVGWKAGSRSPLSVSTSAPESKKESLS